MKRCVLKLVAVIGATALGLAGCAPAPDNTAATPTSASQTPGETGSPEASASADPSEDFKACLVADSGGFDDKSFHEAAHNGLVRAEEELGIEINQTAAQSEEEYASGIQSMVDDNCNLIITAGFLIANATEAAAKQHEDIQFAIIDAASFEDVDNARGLEFNTAEAAFLGGYVAAAMSKTGKVGTFGGMEIPTVTLSMDGFVQGVEHYNDAHQANVTVIGWNADEQEGQFMSSDDPFDDIPGGKDAANQLISQDADIIFPVAGSTGLGALQSAQASDGKVNAIWVDTDGCIAAEEYCDVIISSVFKAADDAVLTTIKDAIAGDFTSDPYVGSLENEGTGLSPFHEFDDKVPTEIKDELDQLRGDIISGDLTITSAAQPK